ncbi:MAG: hypothetical protein RLZZ232_2432 [Planctomycetota bacterium]|jgi:uncharacterized protein (DUF2267 family)
MNASGLEVFDRTLQTAHIWLNDIMEELQWTDRQKAWRAMRTVFHALRDHLPAEENAHLAAQLPLLLRGVWFEGWRPAATPIPDRSRWNFLGLINDAFSNDPVADAEAIAAAVFRVLVKHTGEGVTTNIRNALPGGIRDLWPVESLDISS